MCQRENKKETKRENVCIQNKNSQYASVILTTNYLPVKLKPCVYQWISCPSVNLDHAIYCLKSLTASQKFKVFPISDGCRSTFMG